MDILDEKGVLDKKIMNFVVNKTPVKVFKEGAFGGTYFKDIYPGVNGKWYRKSWKELNQLKDVVMSFIVQIIMMLVLINMVLSVEHH